MIQTILLTYFALGILTSIRYWTRKNNFQEILDEVLGESSEYQYDAVHDSNVVRATMTIAIILFWLPMVLKGKIKLF